MKLNKETKTGLFVVITLAAIILVINYLRGNDLFKRSNDFVATYQNVEGLNPSSPVYIQGFKAGSVVAIKYNKKEGNYAVKLNMRGEFDIPSDSRTEIYSADILGGRAIRIIFGTSDTFARSGDTLRGSVQPDMFSQIIDNVVPLKEKLEVLVANLNETVNKVNSILDDKTRDDITDILTGVRRSISNLEYITGKIKGSTPEITGIITNLNDLTVKLSASSEKLDTTLSNVQAISEEVKEAELKETIGNLKALLIKIQDPDGTVGKLMTTDSLHNSINSLTNDLDSLVKKIERNPKKFLKISVF